MSLFTIDMNIQKSIIINASKEKIWEYISLGDKKNIWSPWIMFEKDCEQTVDGNVNELGYRTYWNGEIIGEGEEILEEVEYGKYRKNVLNFMRPFKSKNHDSFTLEEISENQTKVTWDMDGTLPFFLFFMKKTMIHFIGSDYERGLIMLKDLVETGTLETSTEFSGVETFPKTYFIGFSSKGSKQEVARNMPGEFNALSNYIQEKDIKTLGAFAKYTKSDSLYTNFEYNVSYSISEKTYNALKSKDLGEYFVGILDEIKVAKTTHFGSYKYLDNSWTGAYMYLKPNKLKLKKKEGPLEIYEKGPTNCENEKDYITQILVPVK